MISWARIEVEIKRMLSAVCFFGILALLLISVSFREGETESAREVAFAVLVTGVSWFLLSAAARRLAYSRNDWFLAATPMKLGDYFRINARHAAADLLFGLIVTPFLVAYFGFAWLEGSQGTDWANFFYLVSIALFYASAFLVPLAEHMCGPHRFLWFVFPVRHFVWPIFIGSIAALFVMLFVDVALGFDSRSVATQLIEGLLLFNPAAPLLVGLAVPFAGIVLSGRGLAPDWMLYVWSTFLGLACTISVWRVIRLLRTSNEQLEENSFSQWVEQRDDFMEMVDTFEFEQEESHLKLFAERPTLDADASSESYSRSLEYGVSSSPEALIVDNDDLFRRPRRAAIARAMRKIGGYFWWITVAGAWGIYFWVGHDGFQPFALFLALTVILVAGNSAFRIRPRLRLNIAGPIRLKSIVYAHAKREIRIAAIPDALAATLISISLGRGYIFGVALFVTFFCLRVWSCLHLWSDAYHRTGIKMPYRVHLVLLAAAVVFEMGLFAAFLSEESPQFLIAIAGTIGPSCLLAGLLPILAFLRKADTSLLGFVQPRAGEIREGRT